MKKICALVLAVALVFCLATTAFAANSPVASKKYSVVVVSGDGKEPIKYTYETKTDNIEEMEVIKLTADTPADGSAFDGWFFYHKDGSIANVSKDYYVIEGNTLSLRIGFIPFTDLIVVAQYGGKTPDLTKAIKLFDTTSPKTGDNMALALAGVLFVALCGVAVTKKQLAK